MKPIRYLLVTCCLLFATACSTPTRPQNEASMSTNVLAGSTWQLVSIQSMDDAQGTRRVAQPDRYTLAFGADGRASFRLDCNRGTAQWKASGEASSGSLQFGPLATTRALCPQPSLENQLVRDLPHVRSYVIRDKLLHLALMADGGIYTWSLAQSAK